VNQSSDDALLRIVPLGGLGHIGGNMMAYETQNDLIVVDAGVLFPTHEQYGVDYVIPNISYLVQRRHKLRGYVITHGHEDHTGALPFILPRLPAPIYSTPFTELLLRNKLRDMPEQLERLKPMRDREIFELGDFKIDPLAVTHSIPDAVALAIDTPAGVVLHTGDFKIDPDPLDGRVTDLDGLREYGERGIVLLCSDSTNSEKPGHTWSEREVGQTLRDLVRRAPKRVFLTTFASHIDRIQAVLDAAAHSGRKVMAVGRGMQRALEMGMEHGFLDADPKMIVDSPAFNQIPADRLVVLASGSQGEERSAMTRLSEGQLAPIRVEPQDQVIMSSRRIPGNELAIGQVINNFYRRGAEVIGDHDARVHSSGHGFNDEQREMIEICKPNYFLPLHGELRHMVRHAALARKSGVADENAFVVEDGQPLALYRQADGSLSMRRESAVEAGIVFVDGKGIGDVGESVLRQRQYLSEGGLIVAVGVFSGDGRRLSAVQLATRGIFEKSSVDSVFLGRASKQVQSALDALEGPSASLEGRSEAVRSVLRRLFKREFERRPVIVPVLLDLPHCCCE
jgi:ribonuclease J